MSYRDITIRAANEYIMKQGLLELIDVGYNIVFEQDNDIHWNMSSRHHALVLIGSIINNEEETDHRFHAILRVKRKDYQLIEHILKQNEQLDLGIEVKGKFA